MEDTGSSAVQCAHFAEELRVKVTFAESLTGRAAARRIGLNHGRKRTRGLSRKERRRLACE